MLRCQRAWARYAGISPRYFDLFPVSYLLQPESNSNSSVSDLNAACAHAYASDVTVARLATELQQYVLSLLDDRDVDLGWKAEVAQVLKSFPSPIKESFLTHGHPYYMDAAVGAVRLAHLIQTSALRNIPQQIRVICEALGVSVPHPDLDRIAPDTRAEELPNAGTFGYTAVISSLVAAANNGDEIAEAAVAKSVFSDYEAQILLNDAVVAGKTNLTPEQLQIRRDLEELGLDEPISGERVMLMLSKTRLDRIKAGKVKTVFSNWRKTHLVALRLHLKLTKSDVTITDASLCVIWGNGGRAQIIHFDQGCHLICQNSPGPAPHIAPTFTELGDSMEDNLRKIGQGAVLRNAIDTPAIATVLRVAASAALLSKQQQLQSVRSSGTDDPLPHAVKGEVMGSVMYKVYTCGIHFGPKVPFYTNAAVQQADLRRYYAKCKRVLAVIDQFEGVILYRSVTVAEVRPRLPTELCDLASPAYVVNEQMRPDVVLHEFQLWNQMMQQLINLYREGHTDVADYYHDDEVRQAVRALIHLVGNVPSISDATGDAALAVAGFPCLMNGAHPTVEQAAGLELLRRFRAPSC